MGFNQRGFIFFKLKDHIEWTRCVSMWCCVTLHHGCSIEKGYTAPQGFPVIKSSITRIYDFRMFILAILAIFTTEAFRLRTVFQNWRRDNRSEIHCLQWIVSIIFIFQNFQSSPSRTNRYNKRISGFLPGSSQGIDPIHHYISQI